MVKPHKPEVWFLLLFRWKGRPISLLFGVFFHLYIHDCIKVKRFKLRFANAKKKKSVNTCQLSAYG